MPSAVHVGIDIGTTSAKICAIHAEKVIYDLKSHYEFPEPNNDNGLQDSKVIIKTVMDMLEKTKVLLQSHDLEISDIWTCGQMHGIVFWTQKSIDNLVSSQLYNWTYSNPEIQKFLKTLPKWSCGEVHPGFGLVTMAYLNSSDPEKLKNFDRCGTIMDLFLNVLCPSSEIFISHHNAHSWGYCNSDATWQKEIIDFWPAWCQLPTVTQDNSRVIGNWQGAKCHVATGDLQASVASLEVFDNTAYLILGTSAQLCCLIDSKCLLPTVPSTVVQLPYSRDKKLLAACSMNGGNALESALKKFSSSNSSQKLSFLLDQLNDHPAPSDVQIAPIFLPERGISKEFTIRGTSSDTSDLQILEATHLGIIRNLFSMFPISLLKGLGIEKLGLIGSAQCPRFRRHIEAVSGDNFKFLAPKSEFSTPVGATKF